MIEFFEFLSARSGDLLLRILEHIQLTILAVGIAIGIGVPIGVLLMRIPTISRPVQYMLGIVQTIPSLAMLGLLIPFAGIGAPSGIIALVLYSLLVIVQNTLVGIQQVEPAVIESATGMGMNNWQILFKVQIPLALPVIIAGIRVATVTCVGIATLVAAIGAGGLGVFIFRGINVLNNNLILLGAIPAALLAVLLDSFLVILEKISNKQ